MEVGTIRKMLYQQGKTAEKASSTKLDWPNLTFYAYAADEEFTDLSVVTLISHYETLCHEKAIDEVEYKGNDDEWYANIHTHACEIMDSGEITVRELVIIDKDYNVVVILDEFEVSDEAMDRALGMLEESKMPGITFFGEPVTYTSEQVARHTEEYYNLKYRHNDDTKAQTTYIWR